MRNAQEQAAGLAKNMAEQLAAEPDRRRIDDRHHLFDIAGEQGIEQRLVAVLQPAQKHIFIDVAAQPTEGVVSAHHLIVERGEFALSTEQAVSYARPSIDVLFETAADAYGAGVIGVVMTGANHDGSAGAKQIKERGGRIIVQDPETADCAVMPRAAMNAVQPDRIVSLQEIGGSLVELCGGVTTESFQK